MNKKTKFTSGEWFVKQTAPLNCAWTFDFEKMGLGFSIENEEFEANSSLIKTAPKLYAMLEEINYQAGAVVGDKIEKLLAEARGENE